MFLIGYISGVISVLAIVVLCLLGMGAMMTHAHERERGDLE